MKARMTVALIALVGFFLALYLTLYKIGIMGELACAVGSCERVQSSRYAVVLGVPVAAWGLGFYGLVFSIALAGLQPAYERARIIPRALVALSAWGLLFSAWLTYLELFVIQGICMWCVISALLIVLLAVASGVDLRTSPTERDPLPEG